MSQLKASAFELLYVEKLKRNIISNFIILFLYLAVGILFDEDLISNYLQVAFFGGLVQTLQSIDFSKIY